MKKKLVISNLLFIAALFIYLGIAALAKYVNNPLYDFLASWDTFSGFLGLCFQFITFISQKWWH